MVGLFAAQGSHGVKTGGAPGGQDAGQKANDEGDAFGQEDKFQGGVDREHGQGKV
jgi:hypothetical protein